MINTLGNGEDSDLYTPEGIEALAQQVEQDEAPIFDSEDYDTPNSIPLGDLLSVTQLESITRDPVGRTLTAETNVNPEHFISSALLSALNGERDVLEETVSVHDEDLSYDEDDEGDTTDLYFDKN